MATRAEAVDLLIEKGAFAPQVALAVVEATDVMLRESQVVTVPVLDARVGDLKAEIRQVDHKIDVTRIDLEKKIDLFKAELEKKIDLTRIELERKMDVLKAELEGKVDVLKAELERKMEAIKAELVRWVFLAMLGSGAIQAAATAFINAVQRH
jgi:hypothetical protein